MNPEHKKFWKEKSGIVEKFQNCMFYSRIRFLELYFCNLEYDFQNRKIQCQNYLSRILNYYSGILFSELKYSIPEHNFWKSYNPITF